LKGIWAVALLAKLHLQTWNYAGITKYNHGNLMTIDRGDRVWIRDLLNSKHS